MTTTKAHKLLVLAAILLAGTTAHAQFHAEAGFGASVSNAGTGALSAGASYSLEPLQVQAYGVYQWKLAYSANAMAGLMIYEHERTGDRWWILAGAAHTWYTNKALESGGGAENGFTFQGGIQIDYGNVVLQFEGSKKTIAARFVFKFFNHNK